MMAPSMTDGVPSLARRAPLKPTAHGMLARDHGPRILTLTLISEPRLSNSSGIVVSPR